jgi:hypothetical protein
VTIENASGETVRTGLTPTGRSRLWSAPYACQAMVPVSERFLDDAAGGPAWVRVVLYLTLFGPVQSTAVAVGGPPVEVPGVGLCTATADDEFRRVVCRTAFRSAGVLASASGNSRPDYSPFPADLRIQPVLGGGGLFSRERAVARVTSRAPIAHLRVVIDERDVDLERHAIP